MQSELSQKEERQYHILMHLYGIQKDGTDEPICRAASRSQHREHTRGHSGGRRGRGHTVYLWLIHIDVGQKIIQYCKGIILQLKINKFIFKKTYRRKEKQKKKNILDFELGSWVGPQGHQPACNSFHS